MHADAALKGRLSQFSEYDDVMAAKGPTQLSI